jgi:hypothetical protein
MKAADRSQSSLQDLNSHFALPSASAGLIYVALPGRVFGHLIPLPIFPCLSEDGFSRIQ